LNVPKSNSGRFLNQIRAQKKIDILNKNLAKNNINIDEASFGDGYDDIVAKEKQVDYNADI